MIDSINSEMSVKSMILFLTSSPCIQGADRALLTPENGFIDHLREALPEKPRCLFVCSDPDSHELTDRFARDMRDAFAEADMPFGQFGVLDGRNAVEAEALVNASDFIILAGGHVPTQNLFFKKIRLAVLLEGYKGVIMGVSAGSMNAASIVYVQPELEGESVDPFFHRFVPGLKLTKAKILPHYQQVKNWKLDGKRLFEDITYPDSKGHVFYALVDGSYLYQKDGREWLMGECYRIADGELKQIGWKGDTLAL